MKELFPGFFTLCRQEKHAFTSLRQSERTRVYRSVRPRVTQFFEFTCDVVNCCSAMQLEHERDVFKQYPSNPIFLQKPEDVTHNSRFFAPDSSRLPDLREILAGKARDEQLCITRKP